MVERREWQAGKQQACAHTNELCCAPIVAQKLVVIKPPYAVAASRLEFVLLLQAAHNLQVSVEHVQAQGACILRLEHADEAAAAEQRHKVQLVP